ERSSHSIASDKMRVVEFVYSQRRLKQVAIECDVAMERIRQRLTRRHGAELACVNELTEHGEARTRPANRRQLRIEQEINSGLHGRSAPQVDVSRLVTTGDPQRFSVLNLRADVRGVCTGNTRDDDR